MTPRTFQAENPATGEALEPPFHAASETEVDAACRLADAAFEVFSESSGAERGALLRAIAEQLEARAEALVARAQLETALPVARLQSELGRTTGQLRLFAEIAEDGTWQDVRRVPADPERKPLPRPDLRSLRVPLGPVAVFGASNFPLAFSVAGGDTASALAAGNPVVVKAHPAHPGTSELAGQAIRAALASRGLPAGVFSLLFDDGFTVAEALVCHPAIRAVGFTGSRAGGDALARLAATRPNPIPVFAEMGSVNPVVVLPGALAERSAAVAEGLHGSFTLGVGQFCTNPGVVLVPAGEAGDAFAADLAARTAATAPAPMLTRRICAGYEAGLARLAAAGARCLARVVVDGSAPNRAGAALWEVPGAAVREHPELLAEVFGPSTLLVRYADEAELAAIVDGLEGQLTATVHAAAGEAARHPRLLRQLARKAGRLVFDQFPTGVEVNAAIVHGGPYPATSDGRGTSVGSRAIERFTRLVAFQNAPLEILPPALR
ncbi:MAG: aldehyde dehydrogenase (NADP(+)) [Thermoanaerobaculia bacterium]|nr:aldehyde dehydrogenase (NADP(+)) [Thermoanaerobaculia bacterium]